MFKKTIFSLLMLSATSVYAVPFNEQQYMDTAVSVIASQSSASLLETILMTQAPREALTATLMTPEVISRKVFQRSSRFLEKNVKQCYQENQDKAYCAQLDNVTLYIGEIVQTISMQQIGKPYVPEYKLHPKTLNWNQKNAEALPILQQKTLYVMQNSNFNTSNYKSELLKLMKKYLKEMGDADVELQNNKQLKEKFNEMTNTLTLK